MMKTKTQLRTELRNLRRQHVDALPDAMRGLVFRRPPRPLLDLIPAGSTIGLYRANADEAPASHYAGFFHENGHRLALPRFAARDSAMQFASHTDPFAETDLVEGPFGLMQPGSAAGKIVPDVLVMPLIGFTERGERLGQGGGHYDRWLEQHPETRTIGLAWDCQLVDELPVEDHDRPLDLVVTPTRMYGPF